MGTRLRLTEPSPERDPFQTLVVTRQNGEWCLAAFQNPRMRPMGSNPMAFVLCAPTDLLWKIFRLNK
jgi:hypothetical protein